jgi:hypothetical protein
MHGSAKGLDIPLFIGLRSAGASDIFLFIRAAMKKPLDL